jgi:hypothetical protein
MDLQEFLLEEKEAELLRSHFEDPLGLVHISELSYFYTLRKPNRTRAEHYESLFKNIVSRAS